VGNLLLISDLATGRAANVTLFDYLTECAGRRAVPRRNDIEETYDSSVLTLLFMSVSGRLEALGLQV
jgi:hypothetical protein